MNSKVGLHGNTTSTPTSLYLKTTWEHVISDELAENHSKDAKNSPIGMQTSTYTWQAVPSGQAGIQSVPQDS